MTENDIDLIIKFLDSELNPEELAQFKDRYAHNAEFTQEVKERTEIYLALKTAAVIDQKNWNKLPDQVDPGNLITDENNKVRLIKQWSLRVAAVIVPLMAFTIGLSRREKSAFSGNDLYLSFFQSSQPKEQYLSFSGNQEAKFQKLQKEMEDAVEESMSYLSSAGEVYAYGLNCMEKQLFHEAVVAFKSLTKYNDTLLLQNSEWYLGLCYLKLQDPKSAKMEFNSIISQPSHKYYEDSKKILKRIE